MHFLSGLSEIVLFNLETLGLPQKTWLNTPTDLISAWGAIKALSLYSYYPKFSLYSFFFSFIFISWRLITLQYCSGFCHTLTWLSHGFTCVPHPDPALPLPSPPHPSGSSQCTSPEHLSHASNLVWWSVSHLIIYLFQCYSLSSSHPCLLPQSPKVCSIHLCLFFCLAYRVMVTIFLNSIYMR